MMSRLQPTLARRKYPTVLFLRLQVARSLSDARMTLSEGGCAQVIQMARLAASVLSSLSESITDLYLYSGRGGWVYRREASGSLVLPAW